MYNNTIAQLCKYIFISLRKRALESSTLYCCFPIPIKQAHLIHSFERCFATFWNLFRFRIDISSAVCETSDFEAPKLTSEDV